MAKIYIRRFYPSKINTNKVQYRTVYQKIRKFAKKDWVDFPLYISRFVSFLMGFHEKMNKFANQYISLLTFLIRYMRRSLGNGVLHKTLPSKIKCKIHLIFDVKRFVNFLFPRERRI